MPRYMTQFSYTPEAWAALVKNPQDRGQVLGALFQKLGGQLDTLYYCYGEYDGVFMYDAPDDVTVAAAIMAALSPGHVKAVKTTRLFTVEEAMEAMRKAGGQTYQGPSASG